MRLTGTLKRLAQSETDSNEGADALVLSLVAAACLARAGITPSGASPDFARMCEMLASGVSLRADDTSFARALLAFTKTAPAFSCGKTASRLKQALNQLGGADILDDPLLCAWVFQCLKQKPRWQLAGLSSGAKAQSARACEMSPHLLPELTQWFTPDWIASLLIEATVSDKEAQCDLVQADFLDPSCGAGHILVPALRKLVRRLSSEGKMEPGDALAEVLAGRLFGLDIDPYMIELSGLALYLAARHIEPERDLPLPGLFHFGRESGNADNEAIGSLWLGLDDAPDTIALSGPRGTIALSQSPLKKPFQAVATNPPYLSARLLPPPIADFLKAHFHPGRFDLYAAFLLLAPRLLAPGGRLALVCQQSFMSIGRYAKLRDELIKNCAITRLIQLGPGSFALRSGEKVNNAIVTAEKLADSKVVRPPVRCWRLVSPELKARAEESGIEALPATTVTHSAFAIISGAPFAFWCPPDVARLFQAHPPLSSPETGILLTNGLFTCDNKRFVRPHWLVPMDARDGWLPYDKGGGGRWFRTTPYLLDWGENGDAIRALRVERGQSASLPGEKYYRKTGITYSYIGTRSFAARLLSPGAIFDIASSALFSEHLDTFYLLGFLNASLTRFLLGVLNPTVNFQIGDLRRLPFLVPDRDTLAEVKALSEKCVEIARLADTWHPNSPTFQGLPPAREHSERVRDLNAQEGQLRARLDELIFDIYEIPARSRQLIESDPAVIRGSGNLVSATLPSMRRS